MYDFSSKRQINQIKITSRDAITIDAIAIARMLFLRASPQGSEAHPHRHPHAPQTHAQGQEIL